MRSERVGMRVRVMVRVRVGVRVRVRFRLRVRVRIRVWIGVGVGTGVRQACMSFHHTLQHPLGSDGKYCYGVHRFPEY